MNVLSPSADVWCADTDWTKVVSLMVGDPVISLVSGCDKRIYDLSCVSSIVSSIVRGMDIALGLGLQPFQFRAVVVIMNGVASWGLPYIYNLLELPIRKQALFM